MVWNKTSKELEDLIVADLKSLMLRKDIISKYNVDGCVVSRLAKEHLTPDEIRIRYSNSCRVGKTGDKNPMMGKTKLRHHSAKLETFVNGYLTVFTPDWWEGGLVHSTRAYKHHIVWAEFYKQSRIPKGCVIHHIDCNKLNNDVTNLQLLTISEHMQLHGEIRKVQRLSREGVGNSVPEAHDNQNG